MKTVINLLILILLTLSCRQPLRIIPDLSEQIEFDHKAIVYSGDPQANEIFAFKYFNKKGQLIEQIGFEYRTQFIYNSQGQLFEKRNCRMYNCQIGWREIIIKDSSGNNIGSYFTTDSVINLDTVIVKQVKFYDNENHLIKELTDRGSDIEGKKYEIWKYYSYENNRIVNEVETFNNDTIWIGKYSYNKCGNLIAINRKNGLKYKNEAFEYDQSSNLINKIIESNEYPLTENTSFSVNNNTTTYRYNEQGQLIEEVTYNHKGEEHRKFIYVYEKKN